MRHQSRIAMMPFVLLASLVQAKPRETNAVQIPPIRLEGGIVLTQCGAASPSVDPAVFRNDVSCVESQVQFSHVSGPHKLRLLYYDPDGNLYAATATDWTFQPTVSNGYHRTATIRHELPVAGEHASLLPGAWKATVWLDGFTIAERLFRIERKAAPVHPGIAEARQMYLELRYEEALARLKGVATTSSDPSLQTETYWWQALVYNALGRTNDVLQALQTLLEADPTYSVTTDAAAEVSGQDVRGQLEELRSQSHRDLYKKTTALPKIELSEPEEAPVLAKPQKWFQRWWIYAIAGAVAIPVTAVLASRDAPAPGPPIVQLDEKQEDTENSRLADLLCQGRIPTTLTIRGGSPPYDVLFTIRDPGGEYRLFVEGVPGTFPQDRTIVVAPVSVDPPTLGQEGVFTVLFPGVRLEASLTGGFAIGRLAYGAVVRDSLTNTLFTGVASGQELPPGIQSVIDARSDERLVVQAAGLVVVSECNQSP